MARRLRPIDIAASLILVSAAVQPAFAAREFTPQAGTWVISEEVDGQPGRGVAIDVQGNTFFMQVFNYAKDGSAIFHTAMGQMTGNSVSAPLMKYRGGRHFGSGDAAASEDGSAGDVVVTFNDGLSGTIQLPGESPKVITRMLLVQGDPLYRNLMQPPLVDGWDPFRIMRWVGKDATGARNLWNVSLIPEGQGVFGLHLADQKRVPTSPPYYGYETPYMKMRCSLAEATQVYDCERTTFPTGERVQGTSGQDLDVPIRKARFRILGRDVVGTVVTDQAPAQSFELMGVNLGAQGAGNDCGGDPSTRQGYVPEFVGEDSVCIATGTPAPKHPEGFTHVPGNSVQPVNGTWIVESEDDGRPGRGISLDVQDTVLFAQIANFRKDGSATFHTASGVFVAKFDQGNVTQTTANLIEYQGGRYFGGPGRSAYESANAGVVKISFPYDYNRGSRILSTGIIEFPGEAPKTIRRMAWQSAASHLERVLGSSTSHGRARRARLNTIRFLSGWLHRISTASPMPTARWCAMGIRMA
ncbi:hypothetical protein [Diaphorobacter aerolatus]|uniref:Uncharacterized protein n=1 Tax=Diaphorobacter aerolatus TaxID=1288495 RepID=A0A7H0GN79_9BURK|nr:hypothetical protein [Diaphorobacter aerolatus]QNP49745.1 hypothetical protein H9K75_07430 [Diaphorobacter aerolatus]